MLDDPGLDHGELATAVARGYGLTASSFSFVRGYDMRAASYDVATDDGRRFLKVRFGSAPDDVPLEVPSALLDAGVPHVLAPIRTLATSLAHRWRNDRSLVLYPFVAGRNAIERDMAADQWRAFGRALRAVHDSDIPDRLRARLRHETFALPSAASVGEALDRASRHAGGSAAARRLAALLQAESGRIGAMLVRASELGDGLGRRHHELVPCHADIHAGNLLVADDGRIFLVDWDGPMLAPRERDLLFVIGSRIARDVEPREEAWFFDGYGRVEVDHEALVYYRCERILEDIGEFARSVFDDAQQSEASRDAQVRLASGFFERGGIVEAVEEPRWVMD